MWGGGGRVGKEGSEVFSSSKHRLSGPMLSKSRFLRLCVRLFTFEVPFRRLFDTLPEVGSPIFLEIWNLLGKVMGRSGLRFEYFCLEVVKNCQTKKNIFFPAAFALQNLVETTLPDGLETSG